MKKCKNCNNEIDDRLTYCSFKCRNIYVNKNIRDYSKCKETIKLKNKNKEDEYYINPKKCINCDNIITYEKRTNIYCSKSCSASNNNIKRKGNYKYVLSDNGRSALINSAKKNLHCCYNDDEYINYMNNPKKCKNCNNDLKYKRRNNVFCDIKCKNEFHVKNRTDIQNYKIKCKFKFNLKDYPDEFNFELIENNGWYKAINNGNNLNGVSRDHMYSVMEGFRNGIDPNIISHPANCKLMIHNENISKLDNCSITLDELKIKIEMWNKKYNK